jgi:ABC-2 type transport system permease protein
VIGTLKAEWGKTWTVMSPAGCLFASVLLVVFTATSLSLDFNHSISTGELPSNASMPLPDAVGPALQVGQLLVAAFALILMSTEYQTGAIATTLLAQPRRHVLLAAKTLVAVVGAALTGLVAGPAAAWGFRSIVGPAVEAGSPSYPDVTARTVVLLVFVAVLSIAAATITRNAVGALSVMVVLLVGSLAIPGSVSEWLPGQAGAAVLGGADAIYGLARAIAVLAGWAIGAWALGLWLLQRRDA